MCMTRSIVARKFVIIMLVTRTFVAVSKRDVCDHNLK